MTLKEIADKTAKINGNVTPETVKAVMDVFNQVVDIDKDINDLNPLEMTLLSIAMVVVDEEIAKIQAEFASRN